VTVSSVKIDANSLATIEWSETRGGTKHGTGDAVPTLPAALKVKNTWLIWTEAEYNYEPAIGYVLTGALTLKDEMYMRPRLSDKVCYPSASC
jgi:hypothetical protein